ncbi:hypothetical protein K438DRAFT_1981564 [Mycena galopus ATCC 62051]|nr:hypothetical protein K438DRAFT_1981564 [Mycena galopus ATCC 62051]
MSNPIISAGLPLRYTVLTDSGERELDVLLIGEMLKLVIAQIGIVVVVKIIVVAMVDQRLQIFEVVGGVVKNVERGLEEEGLKRNSKYDEGDLYAWS